MFQAAEMHPRRRRRATKNKSNPLIEEIVPPLLHNVELPPLAEAAGFDEEGNEPLLYEDYPVEELFNAHEDISLDFPGNAYMTTENINDAYIHSRTPLQDLKSVRQGLDVDLERDLNEEIPASPQLKLCLKRTKGFSKCCQIMTCLHFISNFLCIFLI